jgi:hypothetical protein
MPSLSNLLAINTQSIAASAVTAEKMSGGQTGSAPVYGCRAWVNFDGTGTIGTNQTIRSSGNVASVFKNGTGDYTITFAIAMPDANYSVGLAANGVGASDPVAWILGTSSPTTMTSTALRIITGESSTGNIRDANNVHVQIFR